MDNMEGTVRIFEILEGSVPAGGHVTVSKTFCSQRRNVKVEIPD